MDYIHCFDSNYDYNSVDYGCFITAHFYYLLHLEFYINIFIEIVHLYRRDYIICSVYSDSSYD